MSDGCAMKGDPTTVAAESTAGHDHRTWLELGGMSIVVGAVIVDDPDRPTEVLVGRRSGKHAGLWEFPGGKVEPRELAEEALVREIREELGVAITVVHEIDQARGGWEIAPGLVLRLYVATVRDGIPRAGDSHDLLQWTAVEKLPELDWLGTDRAALPTVMDRLP